MSRVFSMTRSTFGKSRDSDEEKTAGLAAECQGVSKRAYRRGSGVEKVARREASGSSSVIYLGAGGAQRTSARASSAQSLKTLAIQRFHLWLPSACASGAARSPRQRRREGSQT